MDCRDCKGGGSLVRRGERMVAVYSLPLDEQLALHDSDKTICLRCDGYGNVPDEQ